MTVTSAFVHFAQSLAGIGSSLVNAVLAIFQAFLALGQEILTSGFKLVQAIAVLATDLVQDTLGFVFANFFLILVLGGAYYWYSNSPRARSKGTRRA